MELSTVLAIGVGGLLVYNLSRGFLGKVAPEKARTLVKEGAKLVDVRTPAEHKSGHIDGSINVPVQELGKRLDEIGDKTKPVIVYCASGVRSASAAGILRKAGFSDVHDLGSIARWGS